MSYSNENDARLKMTSAVKAIGDMELDVLGVPYGGPHNGRDVDGDYFDKATQLHEDKFGLPPAVYYHGYDADGNPMGDPEFIGKSIGYEDRVDGRWYRVLLNKASEKAREVYDAALSGIARASSGSIPHLVRRAADGHLIHWPVAELSIFPAVGNMRPANAYAVALPVIEKRYKTSELETITVALYGGDSTDDKKSHKEGIKMEPEDENGSGQVDLSQVLTALQGIQASVKEVQTSVKADVAALRERVEQMEARPDNDPGVISAAKSAAVITRDGTERFDNYDADDLAMAMVLTNDAARRGLSVGRPAQPASLAAYKALAKRLESAEVRNTPTGRHGLTAMKAAGIKANEISQSTLATSGDEWVGVFYSSNLWESIRFATAIVSQLPSMEVPQGYESVVIPLESTDPTWYKVSQAASYTSNPGGIPSNTVTVSNLGTTNTTLTLAQAGAAAAYTGELDEDSIIMWAPQLRAQFVKSGAEYLESAVIDGDTETANATNINDIAGTPGGTEYWLNVNGFRKLALVTNTANSRSAGTLTSDDFLNTMDLLGVGGANADIDKAAFIIGSAVNRKALALTDVKTRDVFSPATLESGRLMSIYGYPIFVSHHMHKAQTSRLANTSGKIDLDTPGNNTTGSILAVRWDQWLFGWRRRMTFESFRWPRAQSTEFVATIRYGLVYRDTEASAISYNVTV